MPSAMPHTERPATSSGTFISPNSGPGASIFPPEVFLEAEIDKMTGHPLRGLWRLWRHTLPDT